jgi:hypothetical protein
VSPVVLLVCRLTPLVGQGRMTGDELDSSIIREIEIRARPTFVCLCV